MTIAPIVQLPIAPAQSLETGIPALAPAAPGASAAPGFGDAVSQGLATVNNQLLASQADLQNLAVGNEQSLHQVMIKLEESRLSFQLLMQVRSRVLESYQDVMRMQI